MLRPQRTMANVRSRGQAAGPHEFRFPIRRPRCRWPFGRGQRDGIGFKPAGGAFGNSRLFGDDDYMSGAQALVKDRGIFGPAAHDFGAWGDRFEIAADASAQGSSGDDSETACFQVLRFQRDAASLLQLVERRGTRRLRHLHFYLQSCKIGTHRTKAMALELSDQRQHVHAYIDRLPADELSLFCGLLETMLSPHDNSRFRTHPIQTRAAFPHILPIDSATEPKILRVPNPPCHRTGASDSVIP